MTASQSGQNDSEHMIQQSRPDEQAPEDTNPANLSSNPPEGPVSTNEGESSPSMSLHDVDVEIHFNLGVLPTVTFLKATRSSAQSD
ncbi:hypothetical protein FVER53590_30382 [Fusarium verticillioides]|nr:hypothetical protein FVER53590_30382 [Fusarium verticillioides]